MTTDDFKELCRVKHEAIERRLGIIERMMWTMICAAFVQLVAAVSFLLSTFVIKGHP